MYEPEGIDHCKRVRLLLHCERCDVEWTAYAFYEQCKYFLYNPLLWYCPSCDGIATAYDEIENDSYWGE